MSSTDAKAQDYTVGSNYYDGDTDDDERNINTFTESTTTIGDYIDKGRYITDISKHCEMLKACIAISQRGYIIKESYGSSFRYRDINVSDLRSILNFSVKVKVTKKKINKETNKVEKYTMLEAFKPLKEIQTGDVRAQLTYYNRTDLFTDEEGVLSRYVPPQGEANDELAERFIKFFENRVYNPEALHDMLSAHAVRLRHPKVKIEKAFILYSPPPGNTGKTFLSSAIGMIYPELSILGARDVDAKSQFNSMMYDYLNVGFEELQNDNYRNQFFEVFLKQTTNRQGLVRRMYRESESAEIRAIVSLNTNSNDLYGLVRADDAVISRLCILSFKPAPTNTEWERFKREIGLDERMPDYHKTKLEFAAALYHYLKYTYKNPYLPNMEAYSPVRYNGTDKDMIIKELLQNSERLSNRFIKRLTIADDPNYQKTDIRILKKMKDRKLGVVVFVSTSSIERYWSEFINDLTITERGKYTSQSVIEEIIRLGWTRKATKSCNGYALPLTKYEEWRKSIEKGKQDEDDYLEEIDEDNDDVVNHYL